MRIYLAGPMRGYSEFNFPAFHRAATLLRANGHEVFSPAEHDVKTYGSDFAKNNPTGDNEIATEKFGFNLREALGADLAWICREAEAIALLPGWRASKSANAEYATAVALGLQIMEL